MTHATAERAGEKKFWRTVAEVVEAKRLKSKPRVVSVLFASNVKSNLLIAYKSLFDAVVHFDDMSWGVDFSKYLAKLTGCHGVQAKDKCVEILATHTESGEVPNWGDFVSTLKDALVTKRGCYDKQISSSSFNKNSRVPRAKETTLRRSM